MRSGHRWKTMPLLLGTLLLGACSLSTSLVPVLPEEESTFGVGTSVRQPFYSTDDGIYKLTVRFHPEGWPGSQLPIDPAQGATIAVHYAPEDDPRFPEPAFSEWPEHHEWLPELEGNVTYEQTFCSPYPDLSGIRLRVATFRGDLNPGTGVLRPFETIEVRSVPVVGEILGNVPGGTRVEVVGSAEAWAQVMIGEERFGFIDFDDFAELPEPERINDRDVILELYELGAEEPVRSVTLNAGDMFDNSHQSFTFPILEDSLDKCYRFALHSPDSEPGNAITVRYDPESDYPDGGAILNGTHVDGDLVFEPEFDLQRPLYHGNLDEYEWAAPLDAFEARFQPVANTADRYLAIEIRAGERPVNIPWSINRPPGQLALEAEDQPGAPRGGLIFNAAFQKDIPVTETGRIAARDMWSKARMDKIFFAIYGLVLLGTVVAGSVLWWRGTVDGR